MGRIISIDVGQKRIGLAVTDELRIIATPLDTLHVKDVWEFLTKYFKDETVEEAVIGYPLQNDGSDSDSMKFVTAFTNRFRKLYPNVQIFHYDERFTSKMAQQAILMSGIQKSKRQDKSLVDKISATLILQNFMANRENKPI